MKLAVAAAIAALVVTPAIAAPNYPDTDTTDSTTVVPAQANPNVDAQTATADAARQSYYENKLDAAKAQSKVDSAVADRDAAQDRAVEDRAATEDAEANR
jgi:hypothetical protein